jgi:hypothetical protein
MRSISLLFAAFLLFMTGCSSSSTTGSGSGTTGADVLVLELMEIDLIPDSQKAVKVKTGKADKVVGPAADTGVTAKVDGDKVTVAASKEAKVGTHTVKVQGGKKDVELKVNVKKDGK